MGAFYTEKGGYGFAVAIPATNTTTCAIMLDQQQNALEFSTPPVETSSTQDGDVAVFKDSFRYATSQNDGLQPHAWGLPPQRHTSLGRWSLEHGYRNDSKRR